MKTHHFILLTLAMLMILPTYAQWSIGLSGGYAYNHYDYDPQYMSGLDYKGHHGFAVNLPVNYQFNDWFSLSTGLSFQQKGYVLNGSYYPTGSEMLYEFYPMLRRNDSYLVFPLFSEFTYGNKEWKALFDLGLYSGIWCSSAFVFKEIEGMGQYTFTRYVHQSRDFDDNPADRRIEFGIIGGIGVMRSLNEKWSLTASARCYYAVTSQQKDYQIMHFPSHNTTFIAQLGMSYHFKK